MLNRCRKPSDGDILVPGDTVSLIGTTSKKISYDRIDELIVDDDEIEILLDDGEKLVPNLSKTRVLRAYCGVRPLVDATTDVGGRDISRGIVLIDHQERDGLKGLVTIAGGKLMTYRLMAEMTTNLVCKKLGVEKACLTHQTPLPGSEKKVPTRKNREKFQRHAAIHRGIDPLQARRTRTPYFKRRQEKLRSDLRMRNGHKPAKCNTPWKTWKLKTWWV